MDDAIHIIGGPTLDSDSCTHLRSAGVSLAQTVYRYLAEPTGGHEEDSC